MGSIVSQLADAGLIDDFQFVAHPLAMGAGRTLFAYIEKNVGLKLTSSKVIGNGFVLLSYVPA